MQCILQIVDAWIHDMRAKVPEGNRRHSKIYLENTRMLAKFQFAQIDYSGLPLEDISHMRDIAQNYATHHMVTLVLVLPIDITLIEGLVTNTCSDFSPHACAKQLVLGGSELKVAEHTSPQFPQINRCRYCATSHKNGWFLLIIATVLSF